MLRNISPLTETFLRTQQTLNWPLPSKGICKDSCSRLQVGGCKYYLQRRNPTLNFPRSQYVVYPAWAAGWYWARPGDLIEILRKGSLVILLFPSRGSKETSLTVTLSFSSSCRMTISLQGQQDFQKHVVKPPEPRLLLINIVC